MFIFFHTSRNITASFLYKKRMLWAPKEIQNSKLGLVL
jgi:hypothetical protein